MYFRIFMMQKRENEEESLSTWQRFKRWVSRSFSCSSKQNPEDDVDEGQRPRRRQSKNSRPTNNSKPTNSSKPTKNDDELPSKPKVKRTLSFSKDADKMPYIDESTMDIPESVKNK